MALLRASAVPCLSVGGSTQYHPFRRTSPSDTVRLSSAFLSGSPILTWKLSCACESTYKAALVSIRCEQSTKEGNSLDVWLGRLAMIGFAVAIGVEIGTGKGVLENVGLTTPLPTVALVLTAVVGVLTVIFISRSASTD